MDTLTSALKMIGGLVVLIYGMKLLSNNLKKISGGKLEKILTSVTNNPFKGLLVGFIITVATQSSAATTIIVVGLVNSEILKLRNAIPIIMGANIGTTMNSQILRLTSLDTNSWITLLTPTSLAPIILLVGLIIMEKGKKQKIKDVGQMMIGLGLLFTGMLTMVSMASTFSDLPILSTILGKLSNPLLGVLAGALITAIVQSSSATVGILQALSSTGMINYSVTIPIILGQNIGTCATSILASLGASKNAKRIAAVHLYFNLIGTIIFFIAIYGYQHFVGFAFWNEAVDMGQIANFHTLFNIVSTLILFPFISLLEKLTIITIRDKKDDSDEDSHDNDYLAILNLLDERVETLPSIAIRNCTNVIEKMGELSEKNFRKSMGLLKKFDSSQIEHIQERENSIDKIEEKVNKYLVHLVSLNLTDRENSNITTLLKIESDFEKVGDYSYKLYKIIEGMNENDVQLSYGAISELDIVYNITEETITKTLELVKNKKLKTTIDIEVLKGISEVSREKYKENHIERLKKGICSVESGVDFVEILTVCEKIIHHCSNISIAISNYITNTRGIAKQSYYKRIYDENNEIFKNTLHEYSMKYEI